MICANCACACFNPRPSLSRGEAGATSAGMDEWRCFNPRPSLSRGEAKSRCRVRRESQVSIHAPRCRGAKPFFGSNGRRGRQLVSIHAPRCRGAKPVPGGTWRRPLTFQSTPLVVEGRSACTCRPRLWSNPFQSTPLVVEGRSAMAPRCSASISVFQSTPLVVEGRSATSRSTANSSRSFQSTPLVVEGRSPLRYCGGHHAGGVSIHAPRCRGAKPRMGGAGPAHR